MRARFTVYGASAAELDWRARKVLDDLRGPGAGLHNYTIEAHAEAMTMAGEVVSWSGDVEAEFEDFGQWLDPRKYGR
jgi:hypothetical protein